MKNIRIRNGIEINLGDEAYLTIWEDFDGWNIEAREREENTLRLGIRDESGIYFKFVNDLVNNSPRPTPKQE